MHPLVGLQLSGNTLTPLDELAPGEGQLGRPVWNPRQLLSDLELRLGLPRPQLARGLRVQHWSQRMVRLMADSSRGAPYFAPAYAADPTGTAAQLLRMRDELVDAGWDGQPLLGGERLKTLHWLSAVDGRRCPPASPTSLPQWKPSSRRRRARPTRRSAWSTSSTSGRGDGAACSSVCSALGHAWILP